MNKKTLSLVGMIVSILLVLCGIIMMTGGLGGDARYSSGASYLYDSGYASFGADFYTFVSNNAAEAASATQTVASNLVGIADLLKNFCGIVLMGMGAMGFCAFGMIHAGAKAAAVSETAKEDTAEQEEAPAPADAEPEETGEV